MLVPSGNLRINLLVFFIYSTVTIPRFDSLFVFSYGGLIFLPFFSLIFYLILLFTLEKTPHSFSPANDSL